MRRLGRLVVDLIVAHHEGVRDLPPIQTGERTALEDALRAPPPAGPGSVDDAVALLLEHVLPNIQHGDHPRYFARVPAPSNYVSVLGDMLAAGFQAFASSWGGGSGPATLELVVVDWLRSICGLPETAEGLLVSGGSMANLTALIAARTARDAGEGIVYVSDQTHASILRGLRAIGWPAERIRVLPSDHAFRLPVAAVADAVAADRAAGREPFCVIGTAGTTNTGAVDPLPELAALCHDEGVWFHVDGAYGAPAALCRPGAGDVLAGLELADSLVIDPHKWLFQPFEVGCVLVREPGALERAFAMSPEYLRDVAGGAEVNLRDRGLQLTRGSRAIKLWLSVQAFGLDAFRDAVAHGVASAEHAEAVLRGDPAFELVTPAQLGIVTFRRVGADADALVRAALADGYAAPSSTVLHGETVLRLCTINPRTTEAEIEETIARLSRY